MQTVTERLKAKFNEALALNEVECDGVCLNCEFGYEENNNTCIMTQIEDFFFWKEHGSY